MKTKRSFKIISIFVTICLLFSLNDCFYVCLKGPSAAEETRKCFITHVYKEERLLIDLEIPMLEKDLDVGVQVMIINKNENNKKEHKIVFTEIITEAKYKKTLLKETHDVSAMSDDLSLEYETCIFLKNRVKLSTKAKADFEGSFLPSNFLNDAEIKNNQPSKNYLFSVNLLTRFSHILEEKRSFSTPVPSPHKYTKENLELLQKHSVRLLELAKEQISFHRENQKIEAKTEQHVENLEEAIYSMSLTQSALLVFGSLMHINLVRKYLTENKLI